ncbi:FMN-binding negative transcriptional regulator [Flavobacterium sp. MXW15]|uniref:FMN-binding negative transcriptional regulator n=1 Tax=Xanthomonas chitinilytica TaxID=2989819 RepID=A0ABT3JY89_9XANT|nr:FMN-binding negative transcriptional regulator [Xanthomonas sp. H13-6]MCW4455459.1 FMN-binding negative transcriptional regulator [Flavobacterium sp. MXW15]MCW4473460.1 FMN-binding negative transcriptional regulator [Xanthomonas sp. H13-6]
MFTPAAFAETELEWLDRLFVHDPFATLLTTGADGLPCPSLLPVLYRRDADGILIEGHWARPNPQAGHAGPARLLVHGPHAYVSPSWYPDKESASRVPTWNYAAAQLEGRLEPFTDNASLAGLMQRMSARFEAGAGSDWTFDPTHPPHAALLRGIVGFRFRPDAVQIKLKLSQNHPDANQHAVIAALAGAAGDDARQLAQWMRRRRGEDAAAG